MKTFFKLTLALFAFVFFTGALSEATGADRTKVMEITALVSVASIGVRLAAKINGHKEVKGMAFEISHEIWEDFIASNLYKMYPWLLRAKDRSSKVLANAVVHIQQAGLAVDVKLNREVYPVPLVNRADTDLTYSIDELSSNAVRISDAAKNELSPDFVQDNIGDLTNELGKNSAKLALYRWIGKNSTGSNLKQANIVRTTGADVVAHVNATATGNRKKLLEADIASGKTVLNLSTKQETGNRVAIMDENMYNQLKGDDVVKNRDTMDSVGAVWKDGDLVKVHGFEIIRTDVMPAFTNSSPAAKHPLDVSVVGATTDNAGVALLDFNYIHIAKGSIEFFETIKDALAQGDIYSALVRLGASRERADDAGVVAVVQAAGS